MNKSIWMHSQKPDKEYTSSYQWAKNERVFILSRQLKNGKFHNVSFESWAQAKKLNWIKVK